MRIPLSFALACCLLLQVVQGRRLLQSLTPAREPLVATNYAGQSASSAQGVVHTVVALGTSVVACMDPDPATMQWSFPPSPPEYKPSGSAQPDPAAVQAFGQQLCNDPKVGQKLLDAVLAGGQQAQHATYAFFKTDCPAQAAAGDVLDAAVAAAQKGNSSDVPPVAKFLSALASAADTVGIPLCTSLALVDERSGRLLDKQDFHVSTPATGSRSTIPPGPSAHVDTTGNRSSNASSAGVPSTAAPAAESARGTLRTSAAFGIQTVACKELDVGTLKWSFPDSPQEYEASGNSKPNTTAVQAFMRQICSDPDAAGQRLLKAVQAGGTAAQDAVYALFNADCADEEAASDAYGVAVGALNDDGDPKDVPVVASFFSNLAAAADAVGIPVCLSLAVVDEEAGRLLDRKDFHAATPVGTAGSTNPSNTTMPSASHEATVRTSIALGRSVVACKELDPDTLRWDFPDSPQEYEASGNTKPNNTTVQACLTLWQPNTCMQAFMRQICSEPDTAGQQLLKAVQAGGSQAQDAVYALFNADCADEEAAGRAYGAAIDVVNDGDPAHVPRVASFFSNLAAAADAVGIPVCLSLAVVDDGTGRVLDKQDFHAATPMAGGSSRTGGISSTSGSNGGSTGGSTRPSSSHSTGIGSP